MTTFLHDFVNLWKVKERRRPTLRYHVNLCKLSRELIDKFELSDCDAETSNFLHRAANGSYLKLFMADAMHALWTSRTTANGLMNRGGMFVFSTAQATSLLRPAECKMEINATTNEQKDEVAIIHKENQSKECNTVSNENSVLFSNTIAGTSEEAPRHMCDASIQQDTTSCSVSSLTGKLAEQIQIDSSNYNTGSNNNDKKLSTNHIKISNSSSKHNDDDDDNNNKNKINHVHFRTLLDIGAGDGGVTAKLAPLFDKVYATEASSSMRWRLWSHGFTLLDWRDPFSLSRKNNQNEKVLYDVISCLNVLDRADMPLTLLHNIHQALAPRGLLLLAVVMPWCPMVEEGSLQRPPRERLPMNGGECARGASYEASVQVLVENVLKPCGFHLVRWTRLPYLCEGNTAMEYALLSDAVFVLQKGEVEKQVTPLEQEITL